MFVTTLHSKQEFSRLGEEEEEKEEEGGGRACLRLLEELAAARPGEPALVTNGLSQRLARGRGFGIGWCWAGAGPS